MSICLHLIIEFDERLNTGKNNYFPVEMPNLGVSDLSRL